MNLAFQLKIRLIKDVCSEIFLISMKSQKNMLLIEELKINQMLRAKLSQNVNTEGWIKRP